MNFPSGLSEATRVVTRENNAAGARPLTTSKPPERHYGLARRPVGT